MENPMLWGSLAILLFAIVMAVNGRFYPIAFGSGIGLLVLWYLFERESPSPPATEEELAMLSESLHESSSNFDLPEFPEFLHRITPHVSSGFGEREIEKLSSLAWQLPHRRECQTEFQIVCGVNSVPLRVRLFKDNVSSIAVYFFTSLQLAKLIDGEIELFLTKSGT